METLSCPECRSTIRLAALPEGARVRCWICGHEWAPGREAEAPWPELVREEEAPRRRPEGTRHSETTAQSMAFARDLFEMTPRAHVHQVLIAINVLVFLAMGISGVSLVKPRVADALAWGADFGPLTASGEWWRILTCMFVHFGLLHLAFNMWALLALGPLVERLVGSVGFLVLYLVTGLAGSLVSLSWDPFVVSAGASGAVFGVLGVQAGLLLRDRTFVPAAELHRLRSSTIAFIGYNVFFGLSLEGIDNAAHLGGLAAGILAGLVLGAAHLRESVAGRARRNAVLGGIALVILPALALFVRGREGLESVVAANEFFAVEEECVTRFQELAQAAEDGELETQAFALALQSDVIVPWEEAARRLGGLTAPERSPLPMHEHWDEFLEYTQTRGDAWRALLKHLLTGEAKAMERFHKLNEESQRLVQVLNE